MSANIHIAGRNDFPCPIGRIVEEVTNVIRSGRLLLGGEIQRNGVVMFPNEIITADGGDYRFVNFQSLQGFQILFSSFITITLCFISLR